MASGGREVSLRRLSEAGADTWGGRLLPVRVAPRLQPRQLAPGTLGPRAYCQPVRRRAPPSSTDIAAGLAALQASLILCRACPRVVGTPVHGPPVVSRILLVGQAPGPREASF